MSLWPPPGNVPRIEAVLRTEPEVWAGLTRTCAILNIEHWSRSSLAGAFQHVATVLDAARMVTAGECRKSDALEFAAIRLGIKPDTAQARERRLTLRTGRLRAIPPRLVADDPPARDDAA